MACGLVLKNPQKVYSRKHSTGEWPEQKATGRKAWECLGNGEHVRFSGSTKGMRRSQRRDEKRSRQMSRGFTV